MTHYICRGEKCKSVSDRPTICLEPSCMNRYKLLDECDCRDKKSHGKSSIHVHGQHINVINMGISVGLVVGAYLVLLGFAAAQLGWGGALVTAFSDLFTGYDVTLVGIAAGGLWGFVDGFVCGALMAWIYNRLHKIRG